MMMIGSSPIGFASFCRSDRAAVRPAWFESRRYPLSRNPAFTANSLIASALFF